MHRRALGMNKGADNKGELAYLVASGGGPGRWKEERQRGKRLGTAFSFLYHKLVAST